MELANIFDGPVLTAESILRSRTARVQRQRKYLALGHPCLISFSLNIPGEVKQFFLAHMAFQDGLQVLLQELSNHIVEQVITHEITGDEALLCVDLPPYQVKRLTITLEESHPLGRLFDIDVLSTDGIPISRSTLGHNPRLCFLCSKNAKICARSQTHSMDDIRFYIAQLLNCYFRDQAADHCSSCAARAMLYEVSTTPKPGLVDRANCGSHQDMDFFTFLDSTVSLTPWFRKLFCIGWNGTGKPVYELFLQLRLTGRLAERAMLATTGGVNTHKGLIFSMGLLCGALGYIHFGVDPLASLDDALNLCKQLGKYALDDFQSKSAPNTNGVYCFQTHHILGVRGEAALGFPSAVNIGATALRQWANAGIDLNDAAAITLLTLFAHVTDTNMIRRGGIASALRCQEQAKKIIAQLNIDNYHKILQNLDEQYIKANLSPGGCADLLAMSLMLFFLEQNTESGK